MKTFFIFFSMDEIWCIIETFKGDPLRNLKENFVYHTFNNHLESYEKQQTKEEKDNKYYLVKNYTIGRTY